MTTPRPKPGAAEEAARDAQRRAADPRRSVWVNASAGSGKTKVLVDRLLRLLLAGTPPTRLLCLTYTKAAAAEMANRVADRLAAWAAMETGALRKALGELADEPVTEALLARARRLFATLLDAPGGMRIMTIHSFCQSLLARFPIEAGVPPHFAVLEDHDSAELLIDLRERVLARAEAGDDPALKSALAVVTARVGESDFDALMHLLTRERDRIERLFEGAGGIERVIAAIRDALRVPAGATPETIGAEAVSDAALELLGLRFAVAALRQGSAANQACAGAIAAWLAGDRAARLSGFAGYCRQFLTKDGGTRKTLIVKAAEQKSPGADAVLRAEAERLLRCVEAMKAAGIAQATEALLRLAAAVLADYAAAKRQRARLDYADLIEHARHLLRRPGIAPWVLYKLDGGIDHILIDEAQDTAPAQWEIVAALAEEFFAGEGAREEQRTIFAVGDAKQSIFSFQGADPEAFHRMRAHFAARLSRIGRSLEAVPLDVSFRSVAAVLEAVDAVFAQDAARDGVAEAGTVVRHRPSREGQAGIVELWPLAAAMEAPEAEAWDPPVTLQGADDPMARLAEAIADRIEAMLGQDRIASRDRTVEPGDVLVLVRRRNAFVEHLARSLKRRDVPVAGVDRLKLGEHIAVMDLVALGRFLLLPDDDLTLATVLKSPLVGLSEEALFDLAHARGSRSLWSELRRRAAATPAYSAAATLLGDLLARVDFLPPYRLYAELLGRRGGRRRLIARLGHDAADPIDEFLRLALDHGGSHPPTLQGFLHWFEAGGVEIKRDLDQESGGQVRIMTVHGAKGLQAPIVILPDTTGISSKAPRLVWIERRGEQLPLWIPRSADADEVAATALQQKREAEQREYRRLLYVGMTRAEDRLYVGGWIGRRAAPKQNWHELAEGALGDKGEAFAFGETTGWNGVARRLTSAQSAPPDRAHEAGPTAAALPELPDWAMRPAPAARTDRPLAPSRPAEEEPAPLSPVAGDRERAYRRGRLIHRLLQTLPDLPVAARATAARRFLDAQARDLDAGERKDIAARVTALLADPAFASLWQANGRAEQPIAGRLARADGTGFAVAGQIDRLVIAEDAIWIVDYKTNRPPATRLDEVPIVYLKQMATYRALLADIYRNRAVRCFLLWTEVPSLMELPEELLCRHLP